MRCPKCNEVLNHCETDYEKSIYSCNNDNCTIRYVYIYWEV